VANCNLKNLELQGWGCQRESMDTGTLHNGRFPLGFPAEGEFTIQ